MSSRRCSHVARAMAVGPIGTATHFRSMTLVPAAPPWPRDSAELGPSLDLVDERQDAPRVQLIGGPHAAGIEGARYRAGVPFDGYVSDQLDDPVVLVCCHGRRDVCCGGDGTRLARELEAQTSFRVLRTSHLGGHRFAPTALVLPQGTMWAFADAELLTGVVTRTIPVEEALPRYRGCAGLPQAEAQVADAGVLLLNGWGWLDTPREATVVNRTETTSEVVLRGGGTAYRALVGVRRHLPSPTCGDAVVTEATPLEPEYELLAIRSEP